MPPKSTDDLQREVLEAQLETAKINLEQSKDQSAAYRQRKEVCRKANESRQRGFAAKRESLKALQHRCQHMAGGEAGGDPCEGGGKFAFSTLSCTIMPDGVTMLLQCPRCRLMIYGRTRSAQDEARLQGKALEDHLWWKELYTLYRKEGLGKKALMRGPTFNFTRPDGTSAVPDITGYASSGAGS